MSKDTLRLRSLLLVTASSPAMPDDLTVLCEQLRHAPLYDLPFNWAALDKQGVDIDETLLKLVDEFVLPEGGTILLGTPGTLYSFIDMEPGARGLSAPRHFVIVQAQALDGTLWSGPFADQGMVFVVVVSLVDGFNAEKMYDAVRAAIPLTIRLDVTDGVDAQVILDPRSDDRNDTKKVVGAMLSTVPASCAAYGLIGHLQNEGKLEEYRVTPPPSRSAH